MKNLNLITIVYISLLMYHSMTGYIREGTARELLSELHILPIPMRLVPVLAVGLYSCCLLMMSIRDVSGLGLLLKILLEILLGVSVSSVLGFSSKGIFLLILAENMRFFPKSRLKLPIAVGMCLLYLAIDADMISVYGRMIPITQYLQYYQSQVRVILEGILNMAEALNMLLFLIYMLFLIRIQTNEKERVLELNDELNQVNSKLQEANLQLAYPDGNYRRPGRLCGNYGYCARGDKNAASGYYRCGKTGHDRRPQIRESTAAGRVGKTESGGGFEKEHRGNASGNPGGNPVFLYGRTETFQ